MLEIGYKSILLFSNSCLQVDRSIANFQFQTTNFQLPNWLPNLNLLLITGLTKKKKFCYNIIGGAVPPSAPPLILENGRWRIEDRKGGGGREPFFSPRMNSELKLIANS